MNIHKSQLFWCEQKGYKVLTHCHMRSIMNHEASINEGIFSIARFDDVMSKQKTSWNAPNTHSLGCWLECVSSFCRFNSLSLHGNGWHFCVTCDVFAVMTVTLDMRKCRKQCLFMIFPIYFWLVVWKFGTFFIFPIILTMSSSQLTIRPSFFIGVYRWLNHQPDIKIIKHQYPIFMISPWLTKSYFSRW